MKLHPFIQYLKSKRDYRQQIVHVEHIPARAARYGRLDRPLPPGLHEALADVGAQRLYVHQAQSINAIREGEHVIVATPTASGKTLVYNAPVLESILEDPLARALYLFPTKALAQDQLRSMKELTRNLHRRPRFGTYDGDTPRAGVCGRQPQSSSPTRTCST